MMKCVILPQPKVKKKIKKIYTKKNKIKKIEIEIEKKRKACLSEKQKTDNFSILVPPLHFFFV